MASQFKNKSFFTVAAMASVMLALLSLYSVQASEERLTAIDNRPYVVTTTAHIADLVHNIAGDKVRTESLMGVGTDPHLYRPVRSDIIKLRRADMVFYNGRHLEGQMVELLENMNTEKPTIGIGNEMDDLISNDAGTYDPHLWMDAQNWMNATNIAAHNLRLLLPNDNDEILIAADSYKKRLTILDKNIRHAIASIPEQNRILLTAHDAFEYYGAAYGIKVIGVQGISTASEAGLHKIESLVNLCTEHYLPAAFTETSVSDQNIRAIIEGVRARGHSIKIGGTLYSDSLGNAGSGADTYIGMMVHNTNTIVSALGGSFTLSLDTYKTAALD